MENQEFSGRTVEEATKLALEKLGLKQEEVEITVLKKGKGGILGLGAEEARIQVHPLPQPQPQPQEEDVAQIAKGILETLLAVMNLPATVRLTEPPPQGLTPETKVVALDIQGSDLGILIGRGGQTLAALQYMVNLMVSHRSQTRIPVMVDVEEYKKRRYQALHELAVRMAEQVRATGRSVTLEPMPANERRIVHLALAGDSGVATQSLGIGEARKVVIMPKLKEGQSRYSMQKAGEDAEAY